jgi:hypothetical protein
MGMKLLVVVAATLVSWSVLAQSTNPVWPLSPAPVLGTEKDAQGRPLPFGRPRYYPPETPLGSGPYKAVMATEPALPEHVLYYPANLAPAGRLPVVVWGNGGCIHAGNRFRGFLTEIASHGFLVISAGQMGATELEVGAQENPVVVPPGQTPPPPAPATPIPNDPTARWRAMRSTADHLKQAITWAVAENGRAGSRFAGRLEVDRMAAAGQSCGGGLARDAAADPHIKTVIFLGSASTRLTPAPGTANAEEFTRNAKARTDAMHGPLLYITGDELHDGGYPVAFEVTKYITKTPVFHAWQEGLHHIGSYRAVNGGHLGRITSDWLRWQLRDDARAGAMFAGPSCTLCKEPGWHVEKKGMN